MNKLTPLTTTLFFFLVCMIKAQEITVLQPGPEGKDAVIWSNDANTNLGDHESNTAYTWTNGGALGIKRSLIEFDLSIIPSDAIIQDAKFSLFYNPTDPHEGFDFHSGENDLLIEIISDHWDEETVTWNNQPETTSLNQLSLLPSDNDMQDYINIDVTDQVVDMHGSPDSNHGISLRMANETNPYRAVIFASSDHPTVSLHPKLEVTWTISSSTEKEASADVRIIPNPNAGHFSLQWTDNKSVNYVVELFDLLGNIVSAYDRHDDDFHVFFKGVYLLRIRSKDNYVIKKIVVQ